MEMEKKCLPEAPTQEFCWTRKRKVLTSPADLHREDTSLPCAAAASNLRTRPGASVLAKLQLIGAAIHRLEGGGGVGGRDRGATRWNQGEQKFRQASRKLMQAVLQGSYQDGGLGRPSCSL